MTRRALPLVVPLIVLVALLAGCDLFFPPVIPALVVLPTAGPVNTQVTIAGTGFGATQGASTVAFNGVAASVVAWSDTIITARVPLLATPGGDSNVASVVVTVGGVTAGTGTFTVTRGILYVAIRGATHVICLANADGSGASDLTSGGIAGWPQWSPDGTRVAYMRDLGSGNQDIYVVRVDGTGETRLTSDPGLDQFPAWSPDGSEIVFQTDRNGNSDIYGVEADGGGEDPLSLDPDFEGWPSFSPDGAKILFYAWWPIGIHVHSTSDVSPQIMIDGWNYEVVVANREGTAATNLSHHPATDWFPFWSPDGTKIAFQSDREGVGEIFSMNADGTFQQNLTQNPALDGAPVWSPDGSRIAFVSLRDGNHEIYVMNADGTGQARLTVSPAWDAGPTWSPDGEKIAFESDRGGGGYHVYVMDADGTDVRPLVSENAVYPVWTESRWPPSRPEP